MLRTFSGLTTRGRCLLAAGIAAALCAVILNERDLLRIAVFAIALPLAVAIGTRRAHVSVSATRTITPDHVPAGNTTTVHLHVKREGLLPPGEIVLTDSARHPIGMVARFSLKRLPYQQVTSLNYSLHTRRRGIYSVGPLQAHITDLFGLCEYDRELLGTTAVTVVPQVFELRKKPEKAGAVTENDNSFQLQSGQGETDAVVRQYRQGDDLRKVHWRSTARRDELMVRQEEHPWHGGCTVLLDRRRLAHRGEKSASLEWAISCAASICAHIRRNGHHVRLISDTGESIVDSHGGVATFTELMLDSLASVASHQNEQLFLNRDPAPGEDFVAIIGVTELAEIKALAQSRPTSTRNIAILIDADSWQPDIQSDIRHSTTDKLRAAAELLGASGWQVTVASSQISIPEAWHLLSDSAVVSVKTGSR